MEGSYKCVHLHYCVSRTCVAFNKPSSTRSHLVRLPHGSRCRAATAITVDAKLLDSIIPRVCQKLSTSKLLSKELGALDSTCKRKVLLHALSRRGRLVVDGIVLANIREYKYYVPK
jgi:hypothetical protein